MTLHICNLLVAHLKHEKKTFKSATNLKLRYIDNKPYLTKLRVYVEVFHFKLKASQFINIIIDWIQKPKKQNKYMFWVELNLNYAKCRIQGFKPRRGLTLYYPRRIAALRLVLRATLYIYIIHS